MLDLEAIKAREAAATAGPWYSTWNDSITEPAPPEEEEDLIIRSESSDVSHEERVIVGSIWYDHSWAACTQPNAAFIAAARTDVPALIAEVERLQRIEQAARAHLAEWDRAESFADESRAALTQALGEG